MFGGGVNAPAATVCASVIFVFGNASCASCSQGCDAAAGGASPAPTACAQGTMALLTARNPTSANFFTGSSSPSQVNRWPNRSCQPAPLDYRQGRRDISPQAQRELLSSHASFLVRKKSSPTSLTIRRAQPLFC